MKQPSHSWKNLDVNLLEVLEALLTEHSVSAVAQQFNLSQPAISTTLKRLREITGDELLVRSRNGMTPTEKGLSLLEPVRAVLAQLEEIGEVNHTFDPKTSTRVFNIATPDFLSAILLGEVLRLIRHLAPATKVVIHNLGQDYDFMRGLETGEIDVVVANWAEPPQNLRLAPLFEDDIVCLMSKNHQLAHQELTLDLYLNAEHIAPTPYVVGQRGVIDCFLSKERIKRNIVVNVPYFHIVPYLLMQMNAVFSAPLSFAEHFCSIMPLVYKPVPLLFPKMPFYLLWHEKTHLSEECKWFRSQVIQILRQAR